MAAKRYFEFVDGSSNKFWEVWIDGNQVFTRYGKIGASGQTTIKDEGAADKAQKLHDKLVREKTGKGYEEKGGGGGAAKAAPAPVAAKPPTVKKAAPEKAPPPPPAKAAPPKAAKAAAPVAGEFSRFEFVEGGSSKFWEVKVEDSTQTIRYGKIGTLGQEKVKSFGDADAAQADSDKLIAEKTKKGYAPVAAAPSGPPAPELDPKELKKHLEELPDTAGDTGPFLVFADWLESKGHPWGKLIALQHGIATAANAGKRGELEKEEKALLREYGNAIVGGLQSTKGTEFSWHYGFIQKATLGSPTDKPVLAANLQTLIDLPAARMMDSVIFNPLPKDLETFRDWDNSAQNIQNPWAPVMKVLSDLPERVKHVGFGSTEPTSANAYVQLPDLKLVSKALPKVQKLELTGSPNGDLEPLNLPELRSLDVRIAEAEAANLQAIVGSKLPKLERLSVWLGGNSNCVLDDVHGPNEDAEEGEDMYPARFSVNDLDEMEVYDVNYNVNADAVGSFVNGKFPATLKHLGINSANLTADVCDAILKGSVIKQLETLDLSGGTLSDEASKSLIKGKKSLAHLKELNVDRNRLSKDGLKALKSELPNTKVGTQRTENQPEFFFRYVATME